MTRYQPLSDRRPKFPPAAIVVGGIGQLQVWTAEGCQTAHGITASRELIARLNKHAVFALGSMKSIRVATGPDGWELFKWGPLIAWQRLGDTTVYSSRDIFAGLEDDQPGRAIMFLCEIERTLTAMGCRLGSWGSMALQLWRSTLPAPLAFSSQTMRNGLYGPRKQVQPIAQGQPLQDTVYVDLKSAYPMAMLNEPIPTRLRIATRHHVTGDGIARATIQFPTHTKGFVYWSPIPIRRKAWIDWTPTGEHEGWWTLRELRTAIDAGLTVTILETWEGIRHVEPFREWWQLVEPQRNRLGPIGRWFKATSNALWGAFAIAPHKPQLIRLGASGKPLEVIPLNGRNAPPPTAAYVAAEVSARVRERLYREAFNEGCIYADTDGVILLRRGALPTGTVDDIDATHGSWRVIRQMAWCQIKAAQAYRWTGYDGQEHYVVAGLPDAGPDTFRNLPNGVDAIWAI